MTDVEATTGPTHESVLSELYRIRKARAQKHVPYEEDRELKRAERIAWEQAEELVDPKPKVVDPVDRAIAKKKRGQRAQ